MKRKGRNKMSLAQISKKKKIRQVPNRFSTMTKDDWKEANKVSKKNRGINSLSFKDVYGEGK